MVWELICFILHSGLRITIGMDKTIAHTKLIIFKTLLWKRFVYIKWCGATAIIFIPISKLRSLNVEDNINNTFR